MNNKISTGRLILLLASTLLVIGCGLKKSGSEETNQQQKELDPIIQRLINNMVSIEGGTFLMGGRNHLEVESSKMSQHRVTLSPFLIGRYEVTQAEWVAVMGNNPAKHKGDMLPISNISYKQIMVFIEKLNEMTGMQFRLPTDAEWEYAARGGQLSKGYTYSGSNNVHDVAWCGSDANYEAQIVGTKQPNELGLYDMSGNVDEICSDYFSMHTSTADEVDPKGPENGYNVAYGNNHVTRGGAYMNENSCRIALRTGLDEDSHDTLFGFRLAL